eukprot:SAG11_NODE_6192_length_1368_cov_1.185185_1_plen_96_part_10
MRPRAALSHPGVSLFPRPRYSLGLVLCSSAWGVVVPCLACLALPALPALPACLPCLSWLALCWDGAGIMTAPGSSDQQLFGVKQHFASFAMTLCTF